MSTRSRSELPRGGRISPGHRRPFEHLPAALLLTFGGWAAAGSARAADGCPFSFVEVDAATGVRFQHIAGDNGDKHLPATMGSGVAVFDADGDGWLDLYFVQSGPLLTAEGERRPGNVLLRNLGPAHDDPTQAWRFEDWTERLNAGGSGYGQGVLPIDLDGDGRQEIVLLNFGDDVLLRADAAGSYREEKLPWAGWSSSAAAGDVDRDGDLDLFVARYLDYEVDHGLRCGGEVRQACDPALFEGSADLFAHNDGGELRQTPLDDLGLVPPGPRGKGLGVLWSDLDGDGRGDLYVANDLTLNHLYVSSAGGFEELSLLAGTAVNSEGRPEAGMGVASADFDGDGDADLAVTNFDVETNTLYVNRGDLDFEDRSATSGFGLPSFNQLGFGLVADDFDGDGWQDVFVANGHIFEQPERSNVGYAQANQLLRNVTAGSPRIVEPKFEEISCVRLGPDLVSRGAATGDLDRDGDLDLAVNNLDGPATVLRNDSVGARADWLLVDVGAAGDDAARVGAVLTLHLGPEAQSARRVVTQSLQRRWIRAGDSYQSSSARSVRFALDAADPAGAVDTRPALLDVGRPGGQRLRLRLAASQRNRHLRLGE